LTLIVEAIRRADGHVDRGQLQCPGCEADFPIHRGIPRFVPGEGYVASFGRQWTRYAVENIEEDEETLQVKTGFGLGELSGRTVLDAGCGGGRYSFVAASRGAQVIAVDMSRAIDRAAQMCRQFEDVDFVQADLIRLPLLDQTVDLAWSIGVLHHSSDAAAAFRRVAGTVRTGGRLAVWLYRRNTAVQECINECLRGITRRMTTGQLESIAVLGAVLGSIPMLNRTGNKVVNFSNHPDWETRVCDTFDWYSPQYQSHHTVAELEQWFRSAGFEDLRELAPSKAGKVYRWAYERNLIIGSGVNVAGTKTRVSDASQENAHYNSSTGSQVRWPGTSMNQA
jgi:SAM-dependent methyltransferase